MDFNSNIRRIDDLGRIAIPKHIREELKIAAGDTIKIMVENDCIFLIPFKNVSLEQAGIAIKNLYEKLGEIYNTD